jgi:hypothetical protein
MVTEQGVHPCAFEIGYGIGLLARPRLEAGAEDPVDDAGTAETMVIAVAKLEEIATTHEQRVTAETIRSKIENATKAIWCGAAGGADDALRTRMRLLDAEVRPLLRLLADDCMDWYQLGASMATVETASNERILRAMWSRVCPTVEGDPAWLDARLRDLPEPRDRGGWLADPVRGLFVDMWHNEPGGCKVAGVDVTDSDYHVLVALRLANGDPLSLKELRAKTRVGAPQNCLSRLRKMAKLKGLISPTRPIRWQDLTFPSPAGRAIPQAVLDASA